MESVRIFPTKNYAFVNFKSPQSAEAAKLALGGRPVPSLTGTSPLLLRYKRLPPDSSHLWRHPWTANTDTAAGLLPWLMLLQPGASAASTTDGGSLEPLSNSALQLHDPQFIHWCTQAARAGAGTAAAGALNHLANNILAQAIAANGPACWGALATGSQPNFLQALALRNPVSDAASSSRMPWASGIAAGSEMFPTVAATGLAHYGMSETAVTTVAAADPGGLLDASHNVCSIRESADVDPVTAHILWCQGLQTPGTSRVVAVSGGGAHAVPSEQMLLEGLVAASADPFNGQSDMQALLSAVLMSQQHSV